MFLPHVLALGPMHPRSCMFRVCQCMQVACVCTGDDCPLRDLLSGVPSGDSIIIPSCDPSQNTSTTCTITFEGGSVTYDGNSSGSFAFYNVTDAYCFNNTNVIECEAGMWSNNVSIERGRRKTDTCMYTYVAIVDLV